MTAAQKISSTRAKKLIADNKAILLDVRSPVQFRDGTIPGAKNMTIRNVSALFAYPKDVSLILFGNSESDPDTAMVTNYARQLGFTKIFNLGSIDNWQ